MYFVVESNKPFEQAVSDLESAVKSNSFGVQHIHDLAGTLNSKGFKFAEQCKVFEVCNPGYASKVLNTDLRLNMALPCRISVYTQNGKTQIGMIKPTMILSSLSSDKSLAEVADQVEAALTRIIESAA
jgi:uncharacterized protein (DUF302 family)